jgi:aspartyl-tRNA(Asn)/glutamyl-tRNA(Gln) amidotransferase subunit C
MSLTQEQIEKLSKKLSKIRLESEDFTNSINWILKYMDLLNEVDTSWIKPTTSVVESEKENILREDIEKRTITPSELLKCSWQKIIWEQIAVSNIMK